MKTRPRPEERAFGGGRVDLPVLGGRSPGQIADDLVQQLFRAVVVLADDDDH